LKDWKEEPDQYNSLWLLHTLKTSSFGSDHAQYAILRIVKNIKSLFLCRQGDNVSIENISIRLESVLQNLELAQGSLAFPDLVTSETKNNVSKADAEKKV